MTEIASVQGRLGCGPSLLTWLSGYKFRESHLGFFLNFLLDFFTWKRERKQKIGGPEIMFNNRRISPIF